MSTTVNVCNDDGVIFGTIDVTQSLDALRGLAENNGRAWLVFGDGTNLVVTPFDSDGEE
tara:strand:+ start:1187 stop:1363 length:177 start_codon:yes stop_codon:yes gene_type:complete